MDILGTVATIAERMDLVCIGVLFFFCYCTQDPFIHSRINKILCSLNVCNLRLFSSYCTSLYVILGYFHHFAKAIS
jgi:hypothetical protein